MAHIDYFIFFRNLLSFLIVDCQIMPILKRYQVMLEIINFTGNI